MKMKGLFLGMAAFWSLVFVGCTDDVINPDNPNGQEEKVPAYLSVSFSTGSSSSRSTADDANNQGDEHNKNGEAGQEHSGHTNVGSKAENAIYSALLVVKPTNNNVLGYACLYNYSDLQATTHDNENHYQIAKDIELSAATYEVLVVANPYSSLYKSYNLTNGTGTNVAETVNGLYQAILDGEYDNSVSGSTGGNTNNFAGSIWTEGKNESDEEELKAIMMANKSMCQIELQPGADNVACVDIERVASKITYRPVKENNVYPVEVPDLTSVAIQTIVTENGTTYNKAVMDGTTYWVEVTKAENGTETYTYYTYTSDEQTEFTQVTPSSTGTPEWVYDAEKYNVKTWYVKLEKYALVNLSKKVYNVRHTIAGATAVPFGKLTGNNFLYTPNWEDAISDWTINDVKFTETGEFDKTDFTTNNWFYNTLADVSGYTRNGGNTDYFATLPGSYTAESPDDDVEEDDADHYEDEEDTTPAIGCLLAYCLENTTDIEHQTHGLSTGITFMGKIYSDEACANPINTLYRYNGYLFQSIADIKKAYSIAADDSNWTSIDEESDAEELAAVGVVKYAGNTCYYYTTEIKHFDNGIDPGDKDSDGNVVSQPLGNMEFAIMRNNIYSLSVKGINVIGDPWVDPIPGTPDEVSKPKLEVHAEIMPWIVRYHDIEF